MELPLLLQGSQFLLSALLGLCYGLLYDFLRGLRRSLPGLTHLADLLFALCLLACNLLFALYVGGGEYRIFMLLGSALGAAAYFFTLRRLFLPVSCFFWRVITFPIRMIRQLLQKTLKKIIKIAKNAKKHLFKKKKIGYNKKTPLKNTSVQSWEGSTGALLQINTRYQADSSDAPAGRHRRHRVASAEDQRLSPEL